MNPSYPFHRFQGLGPGFLFPADIRAEQRIYGVGVGSVQPLDLSPEPTTYLLVGGGLFALFLAGRGRMRLSTSGVLIPTSLTSLVARRRPQASPLNSRSRDRIRASRCLADARVIPHFKFLLVSTDNDGTVDADWTVRRCQCPRRT